MYTICYIAFFVLSTAAAFKNDTKKLNALYRQPNTVYSAAFITACSHTTEMQKTLILIEIIYEGNFGSEEIHFDFKGGATTALGGATIAD